jgi:hypothetical protein
MQMLRSAALATLAAVLATIATAISPTSHRSSPPGMRPVANVATLALQPTAGAVVDEPAGRVVRWENARLVAAEAEALAAAQAAAKAAAQQAALAKARTAAQQARSAPQPPAAPPVIPTYAPGTVQDIIVQAFTPYGATAVAWGLRVAKCESGYNPRAYNGAGPYYGLFQFLMSTFRATPYGGQDIYDPVANASAAAWKYGQGGAGAWGCR